MLFLFFFCLKKSSMFLVKARSNTLDWLEIPSYLAKDMVYDSLQALILTLISIFAFKFLPHFFEKKIQKGALFILLSFLSFIPQMENWKKNFRQGSMLVKSNSIASPRIQDKLNLKSLTNLLNADLTLCRTFRYLAPYSLQKAQANPAKITPFHFLLNKNLGLIFLAGQQSSKTSTTKKSNVLWNYIEEVKLPHCLKNKTPGKLPDYLLKEIKPYGKLIYLAANAWHALRAAAANDGITLKPTSEADTYRSLSFQTTQFLKRYQTTPIEGASTRHYDGKVWYLKPNFAPMASPGTSNHNKGIAVDVANSTEKPRMQWLHDNVKDFGFSWELLEEPWHIRYWAGDDVPQKVQDWISNNPTLAYEDGEDPEQHNRNLENH